MNATRFDQCFVAEPVAVAPFTIRGGFDVDGQCNRKRQLVSEISEPAPDSMARS